MMRRRRGERKRRSFNCKGREEMGLPARRRDLWILAAVLASEKKTNKKINPQRLDLCVLLLPPLRRPLQGHTV